MKIKKKRKWRDQKENKNKKKANKEVQARQQVLVNTIETRVAFHNGGYPFTLSANIATGSLFNEEF